MCRPGELISQLPSSPTKSGPCSPSQEERRKRHEPDFVFLVHSLGIMFTARTVVPRPLRPYVDYVYYLIWFIFAVHHFIGSTLLSLLGIKPFVLDSWDFYVEGRDEPIRTEVWATWFVTSQYLQDSKYLGFIRMLMYNGLRRADQGKVKVFGLGALNKAEWVNNGGLDLKENVNPETTKIVHGNTMTAAAVAANVRCIVKEKSIEKKVFLTGATSKVGAAVALYLANKGYEVHCCTQSCSRFLDLRVKLPKDAKGSLVWAKDMAAGESISMWIIGKNQRAVHDHIPQGGEAVVFSVPDPMRANLRPDLHITNGAIFELPEGRYTRRSAAAPLKKNQLFACHTGGLVHTVKGWSEHELGEVDWTRLDDYYLAALELGFRLPVATATNRVKSE